MKRKISTYSYAKRKFTPSKKQLFIDTLLTKLDCESVYDPCDSEKSLKNLMHVLQTCIDHVFPIIKLSNKKRKKFRNAWITPGIIKSMDHRDKLFDQWIKNKSPESRRAYNIKRNQVTRIIEAAKKMTKLRAVEIAGSDV